MQYGSVFCSTRGSGLDEVLIRQVIIFQIMGALRTLRKTGRNLGLLLSRRAWPICAPNVQIFLVARSDYRNIFFAGDAIQSRAKVLHLLAVKAAQWNPNRLLWAQLSEV